MARLVIQNGAHQGEEIQLHHGPNSLGRAEGNDFLLDEPTVSTRHCEIVVGEMSLQIRDLGSSNGTFIDGQRIACSEIRNGQRLRLGNLQLQLADGPVDIAIPALSREQEPQATVLPDGTPACLHHEGTPARYRCSQCGKTYCQDCVRELHLVGGKPRFFCAACSGSCVPLHSKPAPLKRSFIRRLLDALHRPPVK